jgi:hypothetical protein
MSTSEPRSCWECGRGNLLRLPNGGGYLDCSPANWKWHACPANLLDTIENPFGSIPGTPRCED